MSTQHKKQIAKSFQDGVKAERERIIEIIKHFLFLQYSEYHDDELKEELIKSIMESANGNSN